MNQCCTVNRVFRNLGLRSVTASFLKKKKKIQMLGLQLELFVN